MCGRFTLTRPDLDGIARELAAEVAPESAGIYRPRWNVGPTDSHWLLRLEGAVRRLIPARFGFATHAGRSVMNARSETAAELPTFSAAFRERRCIVPADSFFEWQGGPGDRRPLWFHPPDGGLLLFAAVAFEDQGKPAFVILTTAANDIVRPVHDRMPVLLSREGADRWLSRADPALLVPAPESAWPPARSRRR